MDEQFVRKFIRRLTQVKKYTMTRYTNNIPEVDPVSKAIPQFLQQFFEHSFKDLFSIDDLWRTLKDNDQIINIIYMKYLSMNENTESLSHFVIKQLIKAKQTSLFFCNIPGYQDHIQHFYEDFSLFVSRELMNQISKLLVFFEQFEFNPVFVPKLRRRDIILIISDRQSQIIVGETSDVYLLNCDSSSYCTDCSLNSPNFALEKSAIVIHQPSSFGSFHLKVSKNEITESEFLQQEEEISQENTDFSICAEFDSCTFNEEYQLEDDVNATCLASPNIDMLEQKRVLNQNYATEMFATKTIKPHRADYIEKFLSYLRVDKREVKTNFDTCLTKSQYPLQGVAKVIVESQFSEFIFKFENSVYQYRKILELNPAPYLIPLEMIQSKSPNYLLQLQDNVCSECKKPLEIKRCSVESKKCFADSLVIKQKLPIEQGGSNDSISNFERSMSNVDEEKFWQSQFSGKILCQNCQKFTCFLPQRVLKLSLDYDGPVSDSESRQIQQIRYVPAFTDMFLLEKFSKSQDFKSMLRFRKAVICVVKQLAKCLNHRIVYSEQFKLFLQRNFQVHRHEEQNKLRVREGAQHDVTIENFVGFQQEHFACPQQAVIHQSKITGNYVVLGSGYWSFYDIIMLIEHQCDYQLIERDLKQIVDGCESCSKTVYKPCCCGREYIGVEDKCRTCDVCGAIQCETKCCYQRASANCYCCGEPGCQ